MATLYTQIGSNVRKTWVLISFFLILIIFIGWILSYVFEAEIILYIAIVFSLLSTAGSYWFSDKIILLSTNAKPIERQDNLELYRLVENLCIAAGLPLPKIYILNEAQPNAFATGRDEKRAVIAVTAGLLEKLDKTELEGVIAHELSHIKNRDMFVQSVVVVLTGVIVFMSDMFFRVRFRFSNDRDSGKGGGIILLILAIVVLILAPIAAQAIRFTISRKREFLADASGALLTRYPEGLANALRKISSDNSQLSRATSFNAHLFIESPFKGKQRNNWFLKLFATHPPVEERIEALLGMKVE